MQKQLTNSLTKIAFNNQIYNGRRLGFLLINNKLKTTSFFFKGGGGSGSFFVNIFSVYVEIFVEQLRIRTKTIPNILSLTNISLSLSFSERHKI